MKFRYNSSTELKEEAMTIHVTIQPTDLAFALFVSVACFLMGNLLASIFADDTIKCTIDEAPEGSVFSLLDAAGKSVGTCFRKVANTAVPVMEKDGWFLNTAGPPSGLPPTGTMVALYGPKK